MQSGIIAVLGGTRCGIGRARHMRSPVGEEQRRHTTALQPPARTLLAIVRAQDSCALAV